MRARNLEAIGRLLFLILGCASTAFASSEIAHISNRQLSTLEQDFSTATVPSFEKLVNKSWTCEMYGTQTRMQRMRGKKLYHFLKSDLKNTGSMPIAQYQKSETGLVGSSGPLQDEIRIKSDGKLIAKFSVQQRPLSYAVCN